MKIQERVLNELYKSGKKMTVKEISKYTGLTEKQSYDALRDLKNRHLIVKERRVYGFQKVTIYAKIDEKSIKRIKSLLRK